MQNMQNSRTRVSVLFYIFHQDFQAAAKESVKNLEKLVDDGSKQKLKIKEKREPSPISYEKPPKSSKMVRIKNTLKKMKQYGIRMMTSGLRTD